MHERQETIVEWTASTPFRTRAGYAYEAAQSHRFGT